MASDPVEIRRRLHAQPEIGWGEFRTTTFVAERLRALGFDVAVGPDAIDTDVERRLPEQSVFDEHADRALDAGLDPDLVAELREGTGVVGTLERGDGPVVGLRTDIDALAVTEATDDDHRPAREGFAAETPGLMHACGHDGHTAIGLGVAERIARDESFDGTLKLFFQPAEEGGGGGRAMASSGHLDDVDLLLAVHLGIGVPSGTIVTSLEFLTVSSHDVTFSGAQSHSGAGPQEGRNALLAAATATQNLYAIPRHADGATRINVGTLEAGTASNVVPAHAEMRVETRGETDDLCEYVEDRMEAAVRGAAESHDVDVEIDSRGRTVSAEHDPETATAVADAIRGLDGVDSVESHREVSGSEDACFLMQRVREHGGKATYLAVGSDLPSGHHTSRFDIDESSLGVGIDALATALTSTLD
ncbi:MAG: amidohydrolase [Halolamina sp.]